MGRLLRSRGVAILGILIAPILVLHALHAPRLGPFSNDPSYYMQAARHVANGDGLMTSISLYHEGLEPLPQPYHDYPLWPLMLGAVASITGLTFAANVLPQLLFAVDLLLFYLLANRLAGQSGEFTFKGETINAGHIAALIAGTNYIFFSSTLNPYTEGLAFALAIASLLTLERPAWSGVLAGFAVLARFSMIVLPAATAVVLLIASFRARRVRAVAVYVATSAAIVGAWLGYLRVAGPHRAGIPRFGEWIPAESLTGRITHIARGLIAALNPASDASLFHSFGPVVLVALVAFFFAARVREHAILFWAVALTGAGSMVALANFESVRSPFWLFGSRHSAPFLFVVIAALVALLHAPRFLRGVAAVLIAMSVVHGAAAAFRDPVPVGRGLAGADRAMVEWLNVRHRDATLLTTNAQVLSVYTANKFHWTTCDVPPEKTRLMLEKLTIDFVIVYDSERTCAFIRGLDDSLALEATFRDQLRQIQVFRVTRKISRTGAPLTCHDATG